MSLRRKDKNRTTKHKVYKHEHKTIFTALDVENSFKSKTVNQPKNITFNSSAKYYDFD